MVKVVACRGDCMPARGHLLVSRRLWRDRCLPTPSFSSLHERLGCFSQCLLVAQSRHLDADDDMSAFGGKADIPDTPHQCPLMTQSGHWSGSRDNLAHTEGRFSARPRVTGHGIRLSSTARRSDRRCRHRRSGWAAPFPNRPIKDRRSPRASLAGSAPSPSDRPLPDLRAGNNCER